MAQAIEKQPVKGGWVFRDTKTGRFLSVDTRAGKILASKKSEAAVKEASSKRSDALKRLADR